MPKTRRTKRYKRSERVKAIRKRGNIVKFYRKVVYNPKTKLKQVMIYGREQDKRTKRYISKKFLERVVSFKWEDSIKRKTGIILIKPKQFTKEYKAFVKGKHENAIIYVERADIKRIRVKGHYKTIKGKRIYVKTHYQKIKIWKTVEKERLLSRKGQTLRKKYTWALPQDIQKNIKKKLEDEKVGT